MTNRPTRSLDLRPGAVGRRRADEEVLAAAGIVAGKQDGEGRQVKHVRAGPLARTASALSEAASASGSRRQQVPAAATVRAGSRRRARTVAGRSSTGSDAGESFAPVGEVGVEAARLRPILLPLGKIGELERQGGRGEGFPCENAS